MNSRLGRRITGRTPAPSPERNKNSELVAFFAFNPLLGGEINEHEKVLFFKPDLPVARQCAMVGLVQAVCSFTETFPVESKCKTVVSNEKTFVFIHPEPDICIVLTVTNPSRPSQPLSPSSQDISCSALEVLLHTFYSLFIMFNGTFHHISQSESWTALRQFLNEFSEHFISTIRFDRIEFYTDINGLPYMPLVPQSFLALCNEMNSVKDSFESIWGIVAMYDHKMVFSSDGLEKQDVRMFYKLDHDYLKVLSGYFVNRFPLNLDQADTDQDTPGKYVTGPVQDISRASEAPQIFLRGESSPKRLVVYKQDHFVFFVIVEEDESKSWKQVSFYTRLQELLSSSSLRLSKEFFAQARAQKNNQEPFRLLYFNHQNLALKSSVCSGGTSLSLNAFKTLQKIHDGFQSDQSDIEQVYIRTRSDGWVVGRFCSEGKREYFALFDDQVNDLIEAEKSMKDLESLYFARICTE